MKTTTTINPKTITTKTANFVMTIETNNFEVHFAPFGKGNWNHKAIDFGGSIQWDKNEYGEITIWDMDGAVDFPYEITEALEVNCIH